MSERLEQIQMSIQDSHAKILELRNLALDAKIAYCEKEKEYNESMEKIYESVGDKIKKEDKEYLKQLKNQVTESKQYMKKCIDELSIMMNTAYQVINPSTTVKERHGLNKYLEMWEKAPLCFAELLSRITNGIYFQHVTVNDVIGAANFNKSLDTFQLIEENDLIYLVDQETGFKSSPCIACHVSSGSMMKDGYRYVNFLTQSGSVYWGSGTTMDQKSRQLLDSKVLILTK